MFTYNKSRETREFHPSESLRISERVSSGRFSSPIFSPLPHARVRFPIRRFDKADCKVRRPVRWNDTKAYQSVLTKTRLSFCPVRPTGRPTDGELKHDLNIQNDKKSTPQRPNTGDLHKNTRTDRLSVKCLTVETFGK